VAQEIQIMRESLEGNKVQEKQDSQMQVIGAYQMVSPQESLKEYQAVSITLAAMEKLAI
jgi:hypothetical protein